MKSIFGFRVGMAMIVVMMLGLPGSAQAEMTLSDFHVTDVTPSGFSLVWRTSEAANPSVEIYADAAGSIDITSQLEMEIFPLCSGDPAAGNEYEQDEAKAYLRATMKAVGMMRVNVHGCAPDTTYFYRLIADNGLGEIIGWPQGDPADVTTALENAFVSDAVQLQVTLTNNAEDLAADGWILMADHPGTLYPVSAVVGDGAASDQAVLSLSQLFGMDKLNWMPSDAQQLLLTVLGSPTGPIERNLMVVFTDQFQVATIVPFTINVDIAGDIDPGDIDADLDVDLADAILALQILSGMYPVVFVHIEADVNMDGKLGAQEVVYILQTLAALR